MTLEGLLPDPLRLLSGPLRALPDRAHEVALAQAFNRIMAIHGLGAVLSPLEGARVDMVITDTGNRWRLTVRAGRLAPSRRGLPPQVTIRGRAADFLALAVGAEDPDTLFFARRLSLEGETETGLELKNILDAVELDWRAALDRALGARAADALVTLARRTPLAGLAAAFHSELIGACRAARASSFPAAAE